MPDRPDHPTILIHIGIFQQRGTFLNICTFIHTYIFYAHGRVIGTQPAVSRGNCIPNFETLYLEKERSKNLSELIFSHHFWGVEKSIMAPIDI